MGFDVSFIKDFVLINPSNLSLNIGNQDMQEYVVKINWFKSTLRGREDAKKYGTGITSHTVCNLSKEKKKFIEKNFSVEFVF